jgi:hypothetical protein
VLVVEEPLEYNRGRASARYLKRKNYAGSKKSLPTIIKEEEPLWYRIP